MRRPILKYPWTPSTDPSFLLSHEWLVTNGLGGYASGTLLGIPTRRYHGVFVPNLPSPHGRIVLIPRLDEELVCGSETVRLSGCEFKDNLFCDSAEYLHEFFLEGRIPVWKYRCRDRLIVKKIVMPYGQNTVYISYRLLEGEPVWFRLRPFFSFRMHDAPFCPAPPAQFAILSHGRYECTVAESGLAVKIRVFSETVQYREDAHLAKSVYYRVEDERGLECFQDLSSPGHLSVRLNAGESIFFAASAEPEELEADGSFVFFNAGKREEEVLDAGHHEIDNELIGHLILAADQFIVLPRSRASELDPHGRDMRTIIAGYHWFTDWGRDTMIGLEGLTLCTGRFDQAKAILRTFAEVVRDGLIPNQFPEGRAEAIYNTVDATLWFFHALNRYFLYTGDRAFLESLMPLLHSIVDKHVAGTHFGIKMDPKDYLVRAGAEGFALTWMDAKAGDWVVTPRRGKPVEIQALWFNALTLLAGWSRLFGGPVEDYLTLSGRVRQSFNERYWFEQGGHLYDVLDGPDGNDASLRPNQLFALSLDHPVLEKRFWLPVVDKVAQTLLTPVGLRTLDPRDPAYRPRYEGDRVSRDGAYHQGTVWPWLLGPFLDAWSRVHEHQEGMKKLLEHFDSHFREAGVGSVSEIFDGEEPHQPRGCIAQAWSVAEILRTFRYFESASKKKGGRYARIKITN